MEPLRPGSLATYIGPTCQTTEHMVNSQLAESSFPALSVNVDIIDPLLTAL